MCNRLLCTEESTGDSDGDHDSVQTKDTGTVHAYYLISCEQTTMMLSDTIICIIRLYNKLLLLLHPLLGPSLDRVHCSMTRVSARSLYGVSGTCAWNTAASLLTPCLPSSYLMANATFSACRQLCLLSNVNVAVPA